MTLRERIADARRQLVEAGMSAQTASLDADVLARHVLGWDRARLILHDRDRPPAGFVEPYQQAIARRARREPVALITGWREFWGRDFSVTPATLVPRPETELIVEEGLRLLPGRPATVLDIGTGSGCLAITFALERPADRVVATDISLDALLVAAANAGRHGARERLSLVCADLVEGLELKADLIVANPPYVPQHDAPSLPADVVQFEPATALFGGPDGMTVIDRLLATAGEKLAPAGAVIVEFGYGQEERVRAAAEREGWIVTSVLRDLQDIARTIVLGRERG